MPLGSPDDVDDDDRNDTDVSTVWPNSSRARWEYGSMRGANGRVGRNTTNDTPATANPVNNAATSSRISRPPWGVA